MTEKQWYTALESRQGRDLTAKFVRSTVAVCGLGGLGSNVAISLARAGIGTLHLVDFDVVDITNTHRQQYNLSQIGLSKTEAMRETISGINPYCNVILHNKRLTADNLCILDKCSIICECFDTPESKAMLVNGISEKYPQKYIVSASGMAGLESENKILTKRFGKRIYLCGDGVSEISTNSTLFAPRVMLCASHQATVILRIIADKYDI